MKTIKTAIRSFLIFAIFSVFNSCKKDDSGNITDQMRITQAKAWYEAQSKGVSASIISSKGDKTALQFNPDWKSATIEKIGSAFVINAKVITNLNGVAGEKSQFNLVISNVNNSFVSKTVKTDPSTNLNTKELFLVAFTKDHFQDVKRSAIISVFDSQFRIISNASYMDGSRNEYNLSKSNSILGIAQLASNPNKTAYIPQAGTCTRWYLETRIYDGDGNLIDIIDTELGVTCTGEEGGGSTGGPEEVGYISFGNPDSEDMGGSTEATETVGTDHFRIKDVTWKFHTASTFYGKSTEHGTVKLTGATRSWHSLTHKSFIKVGFWALGSWDFRNMKWTPLHANGTSPNATMEVEYTVNLVPLNYLGEYNSDYLYSYGTWDVNFNKITF